MHKIFWSLVSSLILMSLTACSDTAADSNIPDVALNCTTPRCTSNSGTRFAVTYLHKTGCAADQVLDADIVAVGTTTVVCDGTGCSGIVSDWTDANAQPLLQITTSDYYVCNWIDLDDNSMKNGLDEYSELRETIESLSMIDAGSTTWGVSYASSNNY